MTEFIDNAFIFKYSLGCASQTVSLEIVTEIQNRNTKQKYKTIYGKKTHCEYMSMNESLIYYVDISHFELAVRFADLDQEES